MFVKKSVVEKLLKLSQEQAVEIAKLQEMLGILAQSQGMQFEFVIGEGYRLNKITPQQALFIEHKRKSVETSRSDDNRLISLKAEDRL